MQKKTINLSNNKKYLALGVKDYLEEFFEKDGVFNMTPSVRKSVLLTAFRDLQFMNGIVFEKMLSLKQLNKKTCEELNGQLPTFSFLLTYFSVIDLFARVMKRIEQPKNGVNRKLFIYSCVRWFNITRTQARAMWDIRNGISHHYHLVGKNSVDKAGSQKLIVYRRKNKDWVIYTNAMFSSVRRAKINAYKYIRSLSPKTQKKYNEYLKKNGFFYIRVFGQET